MTATIPLDLERQVTDLWGPKQWDWVIGRTVRKDGDIDNAADHIWFFYCGEGDPPTGKTWAHSGYGESIADVLTQMVVLGSGSSPETGGAS